MGVDDTDAARGRDEGGADADHHNEVRIRGRVAAVPEERELPSGDRITTARLVVARPPGPARSRQPVDVLDCVGWTGRARRLLGGWRPGAVVEVEGSLRRRFRRRAGTVTSRVEIEVHGGRRVRAPATLSEAPPRRRA